MLEPEFVPVIVYDAKEEITTVGVPLIIPVEVFKDRPEGNAGDML